MPSIGEPVEPLSPAPFSGVNGGSTPAFARRSSGSVCTAFGSAAGKIGDELPDKSGSETGVLAVTARRLFASFARSFPSFGVLCGVVAIAAATTLEGLTDCALAEFPDELVLRLRTSRTTCANTGSSCASVALSSVLVGDDAALGVAGEAGLEMASACICEVEELAVTEACGKPKSSISRYFAESVVNH